MSEKRKILRVADLPEWFDLSKYSGLASYGANEWADAIHVRDGLSQLLGHDEGIEKRLLQLLDKPLHLWHGWRHPGVPDKPENLLFGTVESLSVRSAGFIHHEWLERLGPQYKEAAEADNYGKETDEQDELLCHPFELTLGYEPEATGGTPVVKIDLAAPDEVLVKDFRRWLTAARKRYEFEVPERIVSRSMMQSWIDLKLLPYFDLMLWSRYSRTDIPLHVMGEALFPDDCDGNLAERVRRTVRKRAREVINYNMGISLGLQAAIK